MTDGKIALVTGTSSGMGLASAAVIVEAATTENPKFRYQTSDVARAFVGLKLSDLDGSAVQGQTTSRLD